jgi:hypothetical protein
MTKVGLGMSMSLDGIAGPEAPDEDGMAVFAAILGWQFPLQSCRAQQGRPSTSSPTALPGIASGAPAKRQIAIAEAAVARAALVQQADGGQPGEGLAGPHACLVQGPGAASLRLFWEDPHVPARPGCSKPRILGLAAAGMRRKSRQPCRDAIWRPGRCRESNGA